ncbi:MAG: hypothetical protein WBG92_21410 [Thiohalocapsa sp.]
MPPGDGELEVTGNEVRIGGYPAGQSFATVTDSWLKRWECGLVMM